VYLRLQRDVYGPDAEAYIPSLDEFKQLLEERE
jgi:hypothetical protein